MIRSASKAFAIARVAMLRRTAHIGEVLIRSTFLIATLFIFAQLWRAVGKSAGAIPSGFDPERLVWYLVLTETVIFSTPSSWELVVDREVRSGDVAYRLARPISYPLQHLSASCGERLLRFAVCFGVGSLVALAVAGPIPLAPSDAVAGLGTALLGALIDELVTLSLSLGSFWIENTAGVHLLYRRAVLILGGGFIPLEGYPDWLASACRLLPFRYLAAGPARLFVGAETEGVWPVLSAQLLFGAFALLGLIGVYRLGLRRVVAQGG
jgi:ABC-2 type transport system permease protein